VVEGTLRTAFVRTPGTLVGVKQRRADFHRRMLSARLHDREFTAEYERLYAEMLEQFAPATEGPIVNPGRERRGRLIFGDDTAESR
jgi:hypothetical protein